jgi:hypothetical protein
MVTYVALLLRPLQAGVVGLQFEGLVEEVRVKRFERMNHRQQLQQVRGVRALRQRQLARLEGDSLN